MHFVGEQQKNKYMNRLYDSPSKILKIFHLINHIIHVHFVFCDQIINCIDSVEEFNSVHFYLKYQFNKTKLPLHVCCICDFI